MMMNNKPQYVRFDWAMKRLLRDKANYGVLEGLISTLLNKPIRIQRLLESESNQEDKDDKYNRVDILAEDDKGELMLIEVQNESEYAYFQRMLFGTSKLLTEYINRGQGYENIRKVYSINIVYFNLGKSTDTVYHGKTVFRGIHTGDILQLSPFQIQKFHVNEVSDLYPEYFILRVNDFNKWSKVPLDQWIYFLNTGEIPEDATAPGLAEAKEKLRLERMTKDELRAYYRHLDKFLQMGAQIVNVAILNQQLGTFLFVVTLPQSYEFCFEHSVPCELQMLVTEFPIHLSTIKEQPKDFLLQRIVQVCEARLQLGSCLCFAATSF